MISCSCLRLCYRGFRSLITLITTPNKVPAVMSAVWLNDKGERRAFIANISGEERRFEFKFTPNGVTHSVTLPPRSVMDCEEL